MKTLVTGCAGFIGSHLVDKLLEQGYDVIGIDCFTDYYPREIKEANISNALKNKNFKLLEEDILNMNEYPDVDYVFHEAAQAGVRASWGRSFEIYTKNNIEATQKLLEFYKDRELKKIRLCIVFLSLRRCRITDEGRFFVKASFSLWRYEISRRELVLSLLEELQRSNSFVAIFYGLWTTATTRHGNT